MVEHATKLMIGVNSKDAKGELRKRIMEKKFRKQENVDQHIIFLFYNSCGYNSQLGRLLAPDIAYAL